MQASKAVRHLKGETSGSVSRTTGSWQGLRASDWRTESCRLAGTKGGFVMSLKLKVVEDDMVSKMCLFPQGSDPPGRNCTASQNPMGAVACFYFIYLVPLNVAIEE